MYFLNYQSLSNLNQVAEKIRYRVDNYTAAFPTILEIPSKEHPYDKLLFFALLMVDPEKDSVLKRLSRLLGND
jgi:V-type H+-transporting ATPase subunit F